LPFPDPQSHLPTQADTKSFEWKKALSSRNKIRLSPEKKERLNLSPTNTDKESDFLFQGGLMLATASLRGCLTFSAHCFGGPMLFKYRFDSRLPAIVAIWLAAIDFKFVTYLF